MVLPIAILVILGLVDLGRAVYTYNALAQSARQGTRVAIVNQEIADVRTRAIQSAPTLGLTSSNVDVCFKTNATSQTNCASSTDNCPQANRTIGCLALVRTHVNYTPMTPVISLIWSSIPLSSTSVGAIEYVCPEGVASTCP
jgi:Flp pilus assembly protein TadG